MAAKPFSHRFLARRARRSGAALVEFALIAALFFTMLLGMIQFGIYQSTANTLWNLSREGARFATVSNPSDVQIEDYIRKIAPPNINSAKTSNKLTIAISPSARLSGQSVQVTLSYDIEDKLIFPLIKPLFLKERSVGGQPAQNGNPAVPPTIVKEYKYTTVSTMRVE